MYLYEFLKWIKLHLVLRQTTCILYKSQFLLKKQELLKFFQHLMIIADINSLSYVHVHVCFMQRILAIFHCNII